MLNSYMHLLAPAGALMLNVMSQVSVFRFFPKIGLLKSILFGFVIGMMGLFFGDIIAFEGKSDFAEIASILIVNFIIYLSFAYCYFHFINLGETARRIRILREIYDSKTGLLEQEILERYNSRHILGMRLNRLINNGQIIFKDDRYFIGKPIMLLIAKIIVAMKIALLGKRSEYDHL